MSVFCKYQLCSKPNCRCQKGTPHGPYYWLISYRRKTDDKAAGYEWQYLGKTPLSAVIRLTELSKNNGLTVLQLEERGEKAKIKAAAKLKGTGKKSILVKV